MRKLHGIWRRAFDVREGEYLRTCFMALYFFFVLCARNVVKPVSWSLFLNRFDVDRLPYLYMLIALVGGVVAYFYTKLTVKTSLRAAVTAATALAVISLILFWEVIGTHSTWLLYVFSVWVSLFGIVFVTQGWLIAAEIFDSREAKRLYGLLGLGAIVGAAFGGSFTAFAANRLGTMDLLPVGALFVLLAFASLKVVAEVERRRGRLPRERSKQEELDDEEQPEKAEFSLQDVVSAVLHHRHLLVIVGIISITYVVEVLVEFQFNILAKQTYSGDHLTAFLGTFDGVYLSSVTFVLQFFFTTLIVGRFGVGRTLLISPVSVGVGAAGVLLAPSMVTAAFTRLFEASTRYSFTRTAIELLYLPLPTELKNRAKAFVDVFVDRFGRGIAALLLLLLISSGLSSPRQLSFMIAIAAGVWILLAIRARDEYMATVRRRVESRRLDLEDARVTVQDPETIRLLENAARGDNARQVIYALSLLSEAPGYDPTTLLEEIRVSSSETVRAKIYEVARKIRSGAFLESALAEIRATDAPGNELIREAVAYVLELSSDTERLAAEFVNHPNPVVAEAALKALSGNPDLVRSLVTRQWMAETAESKNPNRRALAAFAVGVRGDKGMEVLHTLLSDTDPHVIEAACRSAGELGNPDYLDKVILHLANPSTRRAAIEALISYGEPICETLARRLTDPSVPETIRRQLPRALSGIPRQASVDVLVNSLGEADSTVRMATLKALVRLRLLVPKLDYHEKEVRDQIQREAESHFKFYAALVRFREIRPGGKVTEILARTLDERLKQTIERLFRLLRLQYPPSQIHSAYLALRNRRSEEFATALDYLDTILDHNLKVVLLPMIDGSPHLLDIGRERFGIEVPTLEAAIREQIGSGDIWLTSCAIAAAAELGLKSLTPDIMIAAREGNPEVARVAEAAAATLA